MRNPPSIEILRQAFTKVRIDANPEFEPAPPKKLELTSNIELKELDINEGLFAAISRVTCGLDSGSNLPYAIDVEAFGEFRIRDPEKSEDQLRAYAMIIAHQVLFASVREMVQNITARSVNGSVNIGISFLKFEPLPEGSSESSNAQTNAKSPRQKQEKKKVPTKKPKKGATQ